MGRRFLGIEEHVAVRCPCCDAVDVDTRHVRICPRSGAQMNQHRPLLHAISHVEAARNFTPSDESANRSLRKGTCGWTGSLRDAPNREYRDKSILLDVAHEDSQAQVHLRGGSVDHDGSAASTSEARKHQTLRSSGTCAFRRTEPQTCHFNGGKLWVPRDRRQQLHRPASS